MGIAQITHVEAQGTADGVTSAAIDTTGATLLVAGVASLESKLNPSFSDSKGNKWLPLGDYDDPTCRATYYFCSNPIVGAGHTFTASEVGSFPAIAISAWSGTGAVTFDRENGAASNSSVTTAQTGSVTPSQNGELVLALLVANGSAPSTPAIDSGLTILGSKVAITNSSFGIAHAYLIQGAAAAINPTWTWTGASDYAVAIATFAPDSSGGSTPPPTPTLAVADNGDGTGATATISGGDAGAVNAVYVAPLPTGAGAVGYTQKATINGNTSGALSLTPGFWIAYAEATESSLVSLPSNTLVFRTTNGSVSRTVTPSGHQGIFIAGVAYLIASSQNFQSLVGAANAAAALPYVKLEADDTEESGSSRPRAIVCPSPEFTLHKLALQKFRPAGGVYVSFELPPTPAILTESNRETRLWDETADFYNKVDPILLDCMNLQGTGTGYVAGQSQVALHSIELVDGPTAINEVREEGEAGEVAQYFYGATYLFKFNG